MAALLDFSPRLMLGEDELSIDEVKRLLDEVEGLAFIKNKWVAVDREKLEQTLSAYEEAQKLAAQEGLTLAEAMTNPWSSGGSPINPTFAAGLSATVTAIPIPPAVWLFGSGLLGLVGIARRKKA